MKYAKLKEEWKAEEWYFFEGWNFSHIDGRWESEDMSWDYKAILLSHLKSTDKLLDMGTGGGEFLLSLGHSAILTTVTESYLPNVELCKKTLEPMGITVVAVTDEAPTGGLPFDDSSFDIIINRHESYNILEVSRILKSGGYFITQQVGGENNYDLSSILIDDFKPKYLNHNLENNIALLKKAGFEIIESSEEFPAIRFYDIGALVYFAKIIEWEFPNFSVDNCFDRLCKCQDIVDKNGFIEGREHRFLIVAKKL